MCTLRHSLQQPRSTSRAEEATRSGGTRRTASRSAAGPTRCLPPWTTSGVKRGGTNVSISARMSTPLPGNFSSLNTTQIIFTQISTTTCPFSELNFTFLCNGSDAPAPYTTTTTTVFLTGTLSQMTWFPGLSGEAPAGPYLGYCGGFDMGAEAGVAFGSLFTRLGIFDPLTKPTNYLVKRRLRSSSTSTTEDTPSITPASRPPATYAQPWAGRQRHLSFPPGHPNGIAGGSPPGRGRLSRGASVVF